MSTTKLRVALIGLGRIGLQLQHTIKRPGFFSHAHTIEQHPDCTLSGAFDPCTAAQTLFQKHHPSTLLHKDVHSLLESPCDALVIAAPTKNHIGLITTALTRNSKLLLLCEKPAGDSLRPLQQLIETMPSARIVVNYLRRWDNTHQRLATRTAALGPAVSGHARFSGSIHEQGSHMIDQILWWFGPLQSAHTTHYETKTQQLHTTLRTHTGVSIHLTGIGNADHTEFRCEFTGTTGRIGTMSNGYEFYESARQPHPFIPDRYRIAPPHYTPTHSLDTALHNLYDNLVAHHRQSSPLQSTAIDALNVHKVLTAIQRSHETNTRTYLP